MNAVSPISLDNRFGPLIEKDTTTFRLWGPGLDEAELVIRDRRSLKMERSKDGFFQLVVKDCAEGTRYRFRANGVEFPDPASRQQDGDTSGASFERRWRAADGRSLYVRGQKP